MLEESFAKFQSASNNELPNFDLKDIMGEFDVDDLGNYIIVRKANS
jgi:hypothetical protein